MDTLTFGLSQVIGIFYKDREWMERVFDDILKHYPSDVIANYRIRKNDAVIELKDSSVIKFIKPSESCRGNAFSKIIVQPGFDDDTLHQLIAPTLKHKNRDIMILKDNVIN